MTLSNGEITRREIRPLKLPQVNIAKLFIIFFEKSLLLDEFLGGHTAIDD